MDKIKALDNLRDTVEILNDLGLYWWLEAGTCLGAIREKDFIEHDTDIDIGVLGLQMKDELAIEMVKRGFVFHYIYGTKYNGYEMSFIRGGIKVDVFYFYKNDGIIYTSIWNKQEQIILDFPAKLFNDLREIDFLGLRVRVPNPPEEYLTIRYGNWREVVKKWDWAYGAKNIRKQ